jgi:glutamate-1-semialdehyde 2,1-aminomutase
LDNAEVREAAKKLFPGGVNSPVRSFRSVGGNPVPIARGQGAHVFDTEGRRYIDYLAAFGPLILGHGPKTIVEAVQRVAVDGTAFGALTPGEVELGRRVAEATGLERVRFVNSGTEATMTAIRLARAATGRDVVVKFDGCYHGHSDGLLVKAGSGVATLGLSDSAGVPEAIAGLTAVLPYNDVGALEQWFEANGASTAAVIVEPIAGNMGLVAPTTEFAEALQAIPRQHGALLIADEVITGFRLRYGLSNVLPEADLVCLGKIIGGGLPVGAFGGRAELMSQIAPEGPVYQAGTLSGNPLVMAAGAAMLDALADGSVYQRIGEVARHLENGLNAAIKRAEVEASVIRVGSMLTVFFRNEVPQDYAEARESDTAAFGRFHGAMRERGVLLPPSQFETWFVSAAHTETEIDETVRAAHEAMREAAPHPGKNGAGRP